MVELACQKASEIVFFIATVHNSFVSARTINNCIPCTILILEQALLFFLTSHSMYPFKNNLQR